MNKVDRSRGALIGLASKVGATPHRSISWHRADVNPQLEHLRVDCSAVCQFPSTYNTPPRVPMVYLLHLLGQGGHRRTKYLTQQRAGRSTQEA